MVTNRYIFAITSFYINRAINALWWRNRFSRADWDDIRQDILIHVFDKKRLCDPKLPFKPWVKTVVHHQLRNCIRNSLYPYRENKNQTKAYFRYKLMYSSSLLTRVKQNSYTRHEEMVCEPDMVDPKTDRTNFDLEDFRTRLGPEQQKLFDFVKQGGSILGASREFGRPYSFFYRQMKQIRAEGKLYLNEAYA